MRDRVRSLMVFTTLGYRLLAFVGLPVLCIVIGYLTAAKLAILSIPGYFVSAFLLVFFELMLDFMVFGGICAKDVSHLDYLKGSRRGELVIRRALTGNIVRMLVSGAVVFGVNLITYQIWGPEQGVVDLLAGWRHMELMAVLLFSACSIAIGLSVIGRFSEGLQLYYILSVVASFLEAGVLLLMVKWNLHVLLVVSVLLLVAMSVLNVQIAMRKIKESYYDKTVTDGV